MKLDSLPATFVLVLSMSACSAHLTEPPGSGHDDGEAGNGDHQTGGGKNDGTGDAGRAASGGPSAGGSASTGQGGTAGSVSDEPANAGAPTNGDAGAPTNDGDSGGAPGGQDGNEGGREDGPGGIAETGGSAGTAGSSGSGGVSGSSGGGGNSGSSGSGGVTESGGSSGVSGSAGSAGISGAAGSDAGSGTGGFAGVSGSSGSGGVAESGGSSGVSGSAGSGGISGSGGVGGSAGDGGSVSLDPEYLFTTEQFGGNGRTCVTCHTAETGTISPAQVQALYSSTPDGPLFRTLDSDDGAGDDYTELREHATFRVTIDLPPGVVLTSDPSATSVVFRRGVPTTINTPALDSVIMWDGRATSLTEQALGAILGHAQATVTPTAAQLELITEFEQGPDFFSSDILRAYSEGGSAPTWPPGVTAAEQRGRRWFAQDSAAPRFNICGQCHGGPMANETQQNSGLPVGKHFQTVNVSEFNTLGNPTYEFRFPDPNRPGQTVTVVTPDPGRALVTGDVRDVNFFKIPTLWGVKNTAPYFHDNSANTLEELLDQYEKHLATFLRRNVNYPTPHVPTAQDKADIIAYLKLL